MSLYLFGFWRNIIIALCLREQILYPIICKGDDWLLVIIGCFILCFVSPFMGPWGWWTTRDLTLALLGWLEDWSWPSGGETSSLPPAECYWGLAPLSWPTLAWSCFSVPVPGPRLGDLARARATCVWIDIDTGISIISVVRAGHGVGPPVHLPTGLWRQQPQSQVCCWSSLGLNI